MKAIMMAMVQIASPLGVVTGYILTTTIKNSQKWTFSYVIQAILFGLCAISVIFIPANYLSISLHCSNPPDHNGKKSEPSEVSYKKSNQEKNQRENIYIENSPKLRENKSDKSIDKILKESDVTSVFEHIKEEDNKAKFFWKSLCALLKVKVFIF